MRLLLEALDAREAPRELYSWRQEAGDTKHVQTECEEVIAGYPKVCIQVCTEVTSIMNGDEIVEEYSSASQHKCEGYDDEGGWQSGGLVDSGSDYSKSSKSKSVGGSGSGSSSGSKSSKSKSGGSDSSSGSKSSKSNSGDAGSYSGSSKSSKSGVSGSGSAGSGYSKSSKGSGSYSKSSKSGGGSGSADSSYSKSSKSSSRVGGSYGKSGKGYRSKGDTTSWSAPIEWVSTTSGSSNNSVIGWLSSSDSDAEGGW